MTCVISYQLYIPCSTQLSLLSPRAINFSPHVCEIRFRLHGAFLSERSWKEQAMPHVLVVMLLRTCGKVDGAYS